MAGLTYLFHGDDEYSIAAAVGEIKASLGAPEALAGNTTLLDGKRVSVAELRMTCDTAPFLADHRLVIAEGLADRFEGGGGRRGRKASDGGALGEWAGLAEYVAHLPATTTLVLTGGGVRATNPLLKSLRAVAKARLFPTLRGARLQKWIGARVRRAGGRIEADAARAMAEFSNGNLRMLDQEIEKLSLYTGGEPITAELVGQMVSSAREARMFDLMDAVVQWRPGVAMRELELLFVQGVAVPVILTMLVRQVRLMVQAKSLAAAGAARPELMSTMGTSSGFVVDKALEQARSYSREELRALYRRILETDLSIKTGEVEGELALELLVAEAAEPRQRFRPRLGVETTEAFIDC